MAADEERPQSPLENAAEHAGLGLPLPKETRLRFAKDVVDRVAKMFTTHQVAFNHAALDVLRGQQEALDRQQQQLGVLQQHVADLHLHLDGLREHFDVIVDEIRQDQRRELARWRSDHALVERMLRQVREGLVPDDIVAAGDVEGDGVVDPGASDDLYQDFEDLHRGDNELVRSRLAAYVPDLKEVAELGRILDIGTGRGEFLEVMAAAGIDAYGVDTNLTAVNRCLERGLDAVHDDALRHLEKLPESYLAAITGFHVVEHLPFERVIELIDHAQRVVRPGGLVIFETPNPSNLVVGASNFYLDPTHRRPWPPPLLHYALWARGFDPIEVRYLNPPPEKLELPDELGESREHLQGVVDRLNELLFAPYDYCVVAHRVGGDE
jgi:O-antigen chain-terminating methyltransferase